MKIEVNSESTEYRVRAIFDSLEELSTLCQNYKDEVFHINSMGVKYDFDDSDHSCCFRVIASTEQNAVDKLKKALEGKL